jgi:hypothetical protein
MLSGVVGSGQNAKIFYTDNLVAMTNSFQKDRTLNGYRMALPIHITDSRGFMIFKTSSGHQFDMVASSPTRPHKWIPADQGYGRKPSIASPRPYNKPIMTTAHVFARPRTDRKPVILLEALKTARATTRSPCYVWWPQDGLVPHTMHNAPIPKLVGDYRPLGQGNIVLSIPQLIRMWRFINTTDLGSISSSNLAASMGSKNGAVDVFALGFVVTLPFHEIDVGDSSVSFIVCIAEFIDVRHTNRGDSKHVLTSIVDAHIVFIQIQKDSCTCTSSPHALVR